MPKPFLNLFQAHTMCVQETGAAMPKIVKSDLFQLIICKDNSEVLCNEVWSYKLAQLIHINVVQILSAIRAATYPPIGFLLRFYTKQQLLKRFYQRQRAITGLCFRPFLVNHSYLTIQHNLCDGVLDCEGFAFKIDRVLNSNIKVLLLSLQ